MAEKTQRGVATTLTKKAKSSSTGTTRTSSSTAKKNILDKTIDKRKIINVEDKTAHGSNANVPSLATKIAKSNVTLKSSSVKKTTTTKPDTSMYSRPTRSKNVSQKSEPLRAKHSPAIIATIKRNNEILKNRSNESNVQVVKANAVLDHVHNVTVLSPPMRRKSIILEEEPEDRPGTHTLAEDEIIILRPNVSEAGDTNIEIISDSSSKPVKESLAFEVQFEPPKIPKPKINDNEESNYSDDFETYESDFETASSSPQDSATSTESAEESETDDKSEKNNENYIFNKSQDTEDEESFSTLYPVTVIPKEREQERQLDSGNYDMNSRKNIKLSDISMQSTQASSQFDSFDAFSMATSDQMDSGISAYENSTQKEFDFTSSEAFYEGYAKFFSHPPLTKRGAEIMSKIQFDTLTYTLFETKPLTYDVFMQIYGKLHTTQSYAQTNENRLNAESQTDLYETRSIWTQHPVKYNFEVEKDFQKQHFCGQLPETNEKLHETITDELDVSLLALESMRQKKDIDMQHLSAQYSRPVDFEKLNTFLIRATSLMSHVLNKVNKEASARMTKTLNNEPISVISNDVFSLDTEFLNSLHVIKVFANSYFDLIITVHESLPGANVYSSEFSNLLVVWSTKKNESSKPIRLLSTWSKVCRAEICNASSEIVVCGLVDGSLAMWDLHETYSYCSKLDGYLTHFAATQSIVPILDKTTRLVDLGAMVDLRSFRTNTKSNITNDYKSVQLASLNESGIVTIWTLVEVNSSLNSSTLQKDRNGANKYIVEYSSPWARVKLIQSSICNICDYIEKSIFRKESAFEKTKNLFQKEIYNDDALKELKSMQVDSGKNIQAIRFTSIETGSESVYISTNHNFILACSKTLKTERFRKIMLNQSSLFPTALCMLSNEDFLAVGFSNGSVSIINCNQNKLQFLQQKRAQTAAPKKNMEQENRLPSGKCCAIQNIILNERRSQDEIQNYVDFSMEQARPDTAACISMITNKMKPFELRVYDQQMIMSGDVLRQHLVQSLAISSDGWRLFVLANESLRVFDFFLDQEVQLPATTGVLHITTARTRVDDQNLIILNDKRAVNVFNLKL